MEKQSISRAKKSRHPSIIRLWRTAVNYRYEPEWRYLEGEPVLSLCRGKYIAREKDDFLDLLDLDRQRKTIGLTNEELMDIIKEQEAKKKCGKRTS